MDWFPAWWLNLMSDPRATVEIGRTRRRWSHARDPGRAGAPLGALTAPRRAISSTSGDPSREIPLGMLRPQP